MSLARTGVIRAFLTLTRLAAGFSLLLSLIRPVKKDTPALDVEEANKKAEEYIQNKGSLKLEIIGLPQQITKEEYRARIGDFKVDRWITVNKVFTEKELDSVLLEAWNEASGESVASIDEALGKELYDLSTRFKFVKLVQQKSGYAVSDLVLTEAVSVEALKAHYVKNLISPEAQAYNDRKPDALNLDDKTFADLPNVVVQNHIKAKDKRKKYNELMRKVEEIREERLKSE